MKVQRIVLANGSRSYRVLDDNLLPVGPISDYLRFAEVSGLSVNTIRNSATHLSSYWMFLVQMNFDWKKPTVLILSRFVEWLRLPDPRVLPMAQLIAKRQDQTINGYLGTVSVFYEYQKATDPDGIEANLFTTRVSINSR